MYNHEFDWPQAVNETMLRIQKEQPYWDGIWAWEEKDGNWQIIGTDVDVDIDGYGRQVCHGVADIPICIVSPEGEIIETFDEEEEEV